MAQLDGRVVLVTGAARGIGAASARRLASQGARLVLADVDGDAVGKLAGDRITSNCVCPGAVDTPMWDQIDREIGTLYNLAPREAWKKRIAGIPLGRPETAEDVAGVVTFLAGPDSDYMTGQAIKVDGGMVMGD
jgi:meso-butanediol dehydrogenase/(S,S)-butanediol dehydrogenase/diacetyl reductase